MLKVRFDTIQPMQRYGNHIKPKKELKVAAAGGSIPPTPPGDDGNKHLPTKEVLERIKYLYNNSSTDKLLMNPVVNKNVTSRWV